MALSNGNYHISCTPSSGYLQFSNAGTGVNITSWPYSGAEAQQWAIATSTAPNSYTFQNVGTRQYAAWHTGDFLVSDSTAMTWYMRQQTSGYVIGLDTAFNRVWNLQFGYVVDNTSIILYPGPNCYWSFTPVTVRASSTSATPRTTSSAGTSTPTAVGAATGSTSSSGKKAGVIAGASVGGVVGAAVLLILAFLQAHNLWYLWTSLGFALGGWWLFGRRRLVFFADKDLGQVEISLFFSTEPTVGGPEDESLLVWQVFKIGHSRRGFSVTVPCIRGSSGGRPILGFGTVVDHNSRIESEFFAKAPAAWDGVEWTELTSEGEKVLFKNDQAVGMDVSIGTYETINGTETFRPFRRLKAVGPGDTLEAATNLYIHAFATHGYENGGYGQTLLADVKEDMLTRPGTKLEDLKPCTHWHITKVDGKLKLTVKGKKENLD